MYLLPEVRWMQSFPKDFDRNIVTLIVVNFIASCIYEKANCAPTQAAAAALASHLSNAAPPRLQPISRLTKRLGWSNLSMGPI